MMGPHYGGINHHVPVVRIIQQYLEDLLPDSGPGPAGEAFVDAFPVAVPSGQVFPLGAAAQHPQYAVDEGPVVLSCNADPAGTPRQETLHPVPLSGAQLVTHRLRTLHHTTLAQVHSNASRAAPPRLLQSAFTQLSISPSTTTTRYEKTRSGLLLQLLTVHHGRLALVRCQLQNPPTSYLVG